MQKAAKKYNYKYHLNEVSRPVKAGMIILFSIYALACVLPVLLIFMISITDENAIIEYGYSLIPSQFSSLAYTYLFSDVGLIIRSYGVTTLVAVVGTTLNIMITAAFSYPLSRDTFYFKGFFTVLIIIPMLFSGGLVPFYMVYINIFHLKNTLLALILPGLFGGFNAIVVRTYLKNNNLTPILEAAYIDGAPEFKNFMRIVLPLSKPVLATIAFFSFLGYWNDWFNCLLFISNNKLFNIQYVMMRALREAEFFKNNMQLAGLLRDEINRIPSEGVRMAMAVVGMAPILAAYPFFQKYFVRGMIIGAVKG